MSEQGIVFATAGEPPTREALEQALGLRTTDWDELVRRAEAMGGRGEWAWNGPKYGWSWRSRRSGRSFLTLEVRSDGIHALVVLGRDDAPRAAGLPLGERMRRTYEDARQYPDGRWLFHRIDDEADVADVTRLLLLKVPPTVRRRLEATEPWAADPTPDAVATR